MLLWGRAEKSGLLMCFRIGDAGLHCLGPLGVGSLLQSQ
jgi:hypothetical protein